MIPLREAQLPPNVRVLASAGSGKTYQLASRYLALIVRDQHPARMLATTFTRLAAGEIRDRVIMRLSSALHNVDERRTLSDELQAELTRSDVIDILRRITSSVHQHQIRTLDSFFSAIVQTFAPELDVPIGCSIVTETEAATLRDEAIALLLHHGNETDLIELLRQLTTADSSRRVHDVIDRQVRELYDTARDVRRGPWDAIPSPPGGLSAEALRFVIEQLRDAPLPRHKSIPPHHAAACDRASAGDWSAFLSAGPAKKIINGEASYYGKPLSDETLARYQCLINHAAAMLFADLRRRNLATADILLQFGTYYEQLKHRQRLITFADLTPSLSRSSHTFQEVCFRLDTSIDHLLLDEFQDTSIAQWTVLRPIVAELLADVSRGRTFFCVGDVKQSIYGWRDAAPEILQQLPMLIFESGEPADLAEDALPQSWRSAQPVIDTVNSVFQSLVGNDALREYPAVAERWSDIFQEHEAVYKDMPGYTELRTLRRAEAHESKSIIRLRAAAQLAADIYRRNPHASIGILARTNRAVGRLLFELGPNGPLPLDVPAGGRGTGSLIDAPVVEALLDLIALADHPDDTIAAFHVASSPVAELYAIDPDLADPTSAGKRLALSRRLRREFAEDGYAETIARWLPTLTISSTERELQRLLQLIELAEQVDAHPGPGDVHRADDFIRLIEQQEIPDVRPAPIQVMTVHKAKGLEFDAVILPNLDLLLRGGTPTIVYQRDGFIGPITRISRYPSNELQQAVPALRAMCESTIGNIVHESLSLLYVAMTRARQGLYLLVNPPGEKSKNLPQTTAGVLLGALASGNITDFEPDAVIYQHGDPDWLDSLARDDDRAEAPALPAIELPIRLPPARHRPQPAAAPSEHARDPAEFFRGRDAAADDRGTALHALFEQIEWLPPECFPPPESAALSEGEAEVLGRDECIRIIRRVLPHRDVHWAGEIAADFATLLQRPNVRACLERGRHVTDGETVVVHRELPFVRRSAGDLQTGSIDRVVVHRDGATNSRAVIYDFKTDRIPVEEAQKRAEHYRGQLETYRAAAAELFKLDPAAIECIVLFVTADVAVVL